MTSVTQFLEETLFDERKIVTCKWLGRHMELTFSEAVEALEQFHTKRHSEKGLNAVHFLSGTVHSGGRLLTLVRDSDLEEAKGRFENLSSCHIYSLQCCPLKSLDALFIVDVEDERETTTVDGDIGRVSIRCTESVKQTRAQPTTAHVSEPVQNGSATVKNLTSKTKSPVRLREVPQKSSGKQLTNQRQAAGKSTNDKRKGGDIKALLTAPPKRRPENQKESVEEKVEEEKKTESDSDSDFVKHVKNGEQNGKFTKVKSPVKAKSPAKAKPVKTKRKSPNKPKLDKSINSLKRSRRVVIESDSSDEEENTEKFDSQTSLVDVFDSTGETETKPNPKPSPRRSPRKHKSSQQTSSQESNESDDIIPPTPPSSQPKLIVRHEQATETFQDDDGFMVCKKVTKTVQEKPSAVKSPPAKKIAIENKKKTGPTAKSPSKKRQATLTNFFKK